MTTRNRKVQYFCSCYEINDPIHVLGWTAYYHKAGIGCFPGDCFLQKSLGIGRRVVGFERCKGFNVHIDTLDADVLEFANVTSPPPNTHGIESLCSSYGCLRT